MGTKSVLPSTTIAHSNTGGGVNTSVGLAWQAGGSSRFVFPPSGQNAVDCAAHSVDHAAELHNGSIAGALDDAAMVYGDDGINQIAADRPEPRERTIFVRTGEPAVADHVRDKDSRDFPGLARCVPPAVGKLAQMPTRVCPSARTQVREAFNAEADRMNKSLRLQEKDTPSAKVRFLALPARSKRRSLRPALGRGCAKTRREIP